MSIKIESTTDTPEQIQAALGKKEEPAAEQVADKTAQAAQSQEEENQEPAKEASESATDENEDLDESREEKTPKKKGGVQKRIDKLTKRISEKDRELEYWKAEAMKPKSQPAEQVEKKETKPIDSKEPKAEDFEKHEDYVRALARFEAKQELDQERAKQREAAARTEQKARMDKHFERVNEFKKAHEDFDDALEDLRDFQLSMTVNSAIIESDFGPQLMYEFAKNPEELKRINALSPEAAARAIGRIEAKFESDSSSEKVEKAVTTQAPKPLSTVGARGAASEKSPSDMTFKEYEKWWSKTHAAPRRSA